MPIYDIWYKRENDGRAPEYAFLDTDYSWAGSVTAASLKRLAQRIQAVGPDEDPILEDQRPLRVGDVVQERGRSFYTFTPSGVWASVEAFAGAVEGEEPGDGDTHDETPRKT